MIGIKNIMEKTGIKLLPPGTKGCSIKNLLMDLNGTLALDGILVNGVQERLKRLSKIFDLYILTADTNNTAESLKKSCGGVNILKIKQETGSIENLDFLISLGSESTITMGNGNNDVLMLREAAIGICVVGPEGASKEAMDACDILVADPLAALDIVLNTNRLIATLRR